MRRAKIIELPTTSADRFRHRWAKAIRDGEPFHKAGAIMELLWIIDELEGDGVEVPELNPEWRDYAVQMAEEFRLRAYGYDDEEISLIRYRGLPPAAALREIAEKREREATSKLEQEPFRLVASES